MSFTIKAVKTNIIMQLPVQPSQVFSQTIAEQGSGSLLALKLALQALSDKRFFAVFSSSMKENAKCLNCPSIITKFPISVARGLACASKELVVVFAGDQTTRSNIRSFSGVREKIIYVCLNNGGSLSKKAILPMERQICPEISAKYKATASIAFPEDYIKKLLYAKSEPSFSFIEVHCPSPKLWGFDPSNTIEVSRVAVNSGVWPLLEFNPNEKQTLIPEQPESVENYKKIQSRFYKM